jgi:hypothetical protein
MARIELKNEVFCGRGFIDQVKPKRIYCQRNVVVLGYSSFRRILLRERISQRKAFHCGGIPPHKIGQCRFPWVATGEEERVIR